MACAAARWRTGLTRGREDGPASIRGEAGIAFLEILVTSAVLGIAVLGVSLMLSTGYAWIAAGADDRAALSLARQKIEQLRSVTFACIPLGGPGPKTAMTGCTATQNYNEGGTTWVTATGGSAGAPSGRSFTRVTCVEYVSETDFGSPALASGSVAGSCSVGAPTSVKRITVTVQGRGQAAEDAPVMLKAWITAIPGGL